MVHRRDGLETRTNVLAAAVEVFAEKGHSDALVAEICERAGANGAAVNYHFGGKDELYVEVWRHLGQESQNLYPPSGGAPAGAPLEERLLAHIRAMLQRMTDDGRLGCLHRLYEHERSRPTGLIDEVLRQMHEPTFQVLQALVREALGPDVPQESAHMAVYSIVNQCRGVMGKDCLGPHLLGRKPLAPAAIEQLAQHIAQFSTGGMAAVRQRRTQEEST